MLSQSNLAKVLCAGCCLAGLLWSVQGSAQDTLPSGVYYPLKVGNQWTYRAGDQKVIERVDKLVTLEVQKGDKVEKIPAFRLVTTNRAHKDRELTENIAVLADGIYRYPTDDKDTSGPVCLLKLPVPRAGESWPVTTATVRGSCKATMDDVTVPLGVFKGALLVSGDFQVGAKKMTVETWFAAGTGIVKKRVKLGSDTTDLELEKFEEAK